MKRQLTALLAAVTVLSGCSGGGSTPNAAQVAGCPVTPNGATGAVYPANAAFSVPFSSSNASGTLDFAAVNFCVQAPAGVGARTPAGDTPPLTLATGQTLITYVNQQLGGEAYLSDPATIHITVPSQYVGRTITIYNYYYTSWETDFSGLATSTSFVLQSQQQNQAFALGMNVLAIVAN